MEKTKNVVKTDSHQKKLEKLRQVINGDKYSKMKTNELP